MKRPTAFITGIAGFAGSYLAEELLRKGYRVAGNLYRNEPTDNIDTIINALSLVDLDILDSSHLEQTIKKIKPDYIFHLAAMASVGKSFTNESLTLKVNIDGTLNILQAAGKLKHLKKMVFISSADCFGIFKPKNKTLSEDHPLNPRSPYGISKAAGEYLCNYYYHQYNIPVSIARSFNHSGPRQTDSFVIPAFARQVAAIEKGRQKPIIAVGDLSAKRDFSDVRDIVRGYRLLAEKGKPGRVYHFCSGKSVAIKVALNTLLKFSSKQIEVKIDKKRLRKSDIPVLRGNNRRAIQELGFKTRYKLKQTLRDTFDYWVEKLS